MLQPIPRCCWAVNFTIWEKRNFRLKKDMKPHRENEESAAVRYLRFLNIPKLRRG